MAANAFRGEQAVYREKLKKWVKMGIAVIVSATAIMSTGASAEDSVEIEKAVEEVVVVAKTGSRITTNLNATQPISSITSDELLSSGALTVAEAINQLPQLGDALEGGSSINALNSGFGVGTQTVNLRNLGANRTLVLVNGRRHVGGDVGSGAVDLNTIPVGMIDHIDILTGGASAVYGADAVTGVVNILLKDNFEGSRVGVRYGISKEGDADEFAINGTHGGVFERGNYILSVEYSQQNPIVGQDRSFAQNDGSAATGTSNPSNGSGVNPGGLYSVGTGGTGGFNVAGDFVSPFAERFQRVPFRFLQNDTDRLVISGRGAFKLSDSIQVFLESTFSNTRSSVQFEPQLAVFSNARFGSSGTAGFRFPTAPTVPFEATTLRAITRRFTEFGPRSSEIDRDMFRVTLGLEGAFGATDYELYYQYGRVEAEQTDFNTIDKLRLLTAIDRTACVAVAGCQFADIYGRDSLSASALDFVSDNLTSSSLGKQHVLGGYIAGDLFRLSQSNVSYVLGGEYRKEEVEITPNAGLIAVDNPRNPNAGQLVGLKGTRTFFGNTSGDYDVAEVFGELFVPITSRLNVGGSARISHYSTVGTELTYGANVNFALNNFVTFRSSYGSATRAPNIGELLAPDRVQTTGIADPCDTAADDGTLLTPAAGCASQGFSSSHNPTDIDQQIRGLTGGNPNLDSESATTISAGAILFLSENTDLTLDYYSIKLKDVLAPAFSAQATLDRCRATGEAFFCDNVTIDAATRFVTAIRSEQVNLSRETVNGFDVAFAHTQPLNSNAALKFFGIYSFLIDHKRQADDAAAVEELVGRVDNIEHKINFTVAYDHTSWDVGVTGRLLDGAKQDLAADSAVALGNEIKPQYYFDLHGGVNLFNNRVRLSTGIENITNKRPPIVTQLFANTGSADVTAAGIYDVRGRFFYINTSFAF